MPRRRRYDPPSLPQQPNLATDPVREAEILADFQRKVRFLVRSYQTERQLGLDRASLNTSLIRLKRAVRKPAPEGARHSRLNPLLEMAINDEARELAGIRHDEPLRGEHGKYVRQAVKNVAARSRVIRGKPGNLVLRRYVEGLMALIQEATGKPVLALRYKEAVYDPQLMGLSGAAMRKIVDHMEPGVTDTTLAYWISEARKKYVGGWPTFASLFPGYALAQEPHPPSEMLPEWGPNVQASVLQPIYCPF